MVVWEGLDYTAIGGRIRFRRQELELTQGQLARRTGVTSSFIGHIERAEKVPSIETIARLSAALEMSLDELVFGIRHRCEGHKCPLYADVAELLSDYGLGKSNP